MYSFLYHKTYTVIYYNNATYDQKTWILVATINCKFLI